MSYIIGQNNNPYVNFLLNPGESASIWWDGFGQDGVGYNTGSAFPSSVYTESNRVVTDNVGMEWSASAGPSGVVYTIDLHAENSLGTGIQAVFRVQIGSLQ
jgi:hypothetical protein